MDLIWLKSYWNLNGNHSLSLFQFVKCEFLLGRIIVLTVCVFQVWFLKGLLLFFVFVGVGILLFPAPSNVLTKRFWPEVSYLFLSGLPYEKKKCLPLFWEKNWEPLKELWEPYSLRFHPKTSLRKDQRLCCWCACVRARRCSITGFTHNLPWVFRLRHAQIQYEKLGSDTIALSEWLFVLGFCLVFICLDVS